jgi:hypothetical protein
MTVEETLALDVDYVQIVGAAGEPEFGSPRTLEETHQDINEWMEGLRAGGGNGYVSGILSWPHRINATQKRLEVEKRGEAYPGARGGPHAATQP